MKIPKNDSLIGKYFHTYTPQGEIRWQGQVTGEPAPGVFLVQIYEWIWGIPKGKYLMPITQMMDWVFSDNAKEWRKSGLQEMTGPKASWRSEAVGLIHDREEKAAQA